MGTGFTQKGQVEPGTLPALPSGGHSTGIKLWVTQLEAGDILRVRREGQYESI